MRLAPLMPRGVNAAKSEPLSPQQQSARSTDALTALVNFDADQAARRTKSHDHLHPTVQKVAAGLSPSAARLLDLVVKADEHAKSACLIQIDRFEVAKALSVKDEDADNARSELLRKGLLRRYDNGSGLSGFRPVL